MKLQNKLDVHSAGGRMRATSAMKLFKNFLLINKLSLKEGLQSEVRRVEWRRSTGRWFSPVDASVEWIESGLKEVVDSGFERCRMRLPLERRSSDRRRKWLSRKKFLRKQNRKTA